VEAAGSSRSTDRAELLFPAKKPGRSPEEIARAAVARMPTTVSGHRVIMKPTLFLTREVAEYILARAIREGKNTGVIGDILTAESRRRDDGRRWARPVRADDGPTLLQDPERGSVGPQLQGPRGRSERRHSPPRSYGLCRQANGLDWASRPSRFLRDSSSMELGGDAGHGGGC
jgi:hypothetical protein